VISRKDVQYFPSSLSTITPTTSRVVRVPLTSGSDFIDPESIKVAFRFVNNDGTNDYHPVMGHPACLIKRIQLFAIGQRTDDIDNYGRTVHLYTLLKPREWWVNQANEGFEVNEVGGFPQPLPESHFQEVLMAPTLVGLLGCGKMLPPQLNLVLEIEFADPADNVRGARTAPWTSASKTSGFWPRRSPSTAPWSKASTECSSRAAASCSPIRRFTRR